MKILVTGGLGSIGYVLVNYLKKRTRRFFVIYLTLMKKIILDAISLVLINLITCLIKTNLIMFFT